MHVWVLRGGCCSPAGGREVPQAAVARQIRLSRGTVARRSLGTAEVLDEMPGLRAAVDSGEVALANAERLADAAQRTAPEAVNSDSDLLAMAKDLPPDKFAREASAWAQRHQPDHGHGDWLEKRRRRYLKTRKPQDGMVRLEGLLDPEAGTRICKPDRACPSDRRPQPATAKHPPCSPPKAPTPEATQEPNLRRPKDPDTNPE